MCYSYKKYKIDIKDDSGNCRLFLIKSLLALDRKRKSSMIL